MTGGNDRVGSSVRTILIASAPRSGSTLLGRLLAQRTGGLFVGEFDRFWRVYFNGILCSCRVPVGECAIWSEAAALTLASCADGGGARAMHALEERLRAGRRLTQRERRVLADVVMTLHRCGAQLTGARLVIDSSKSVGYHQLIASHAEPSTVGMVRLTRDPRAAVYSRVRSRRRRLVDRSHPRPLVARLTLPLVALDAAAWARTERSISAVAERIHGPVSSVRYEDLADDPHAVVGRVVEGLGVSDDAQGEAIEHVAAGNRNRFTPLSPVRIDDAWRAEMPRLQRGLVRAMAGRGTARPG